MRAMPTKRKGKKKYNTSWQATITKFKNMHSVLGAWKAQGTGLELSTESSKGAKIEVHMLWSAYVHTRHNVFNPFTMACLGLET